MALSVGTVMDTRINLGTRFGALDTSVSGSARSKMLKSLGSGKLIDGEASLLELERLAKNYDQPTSATVFLREAFAPTSRPEPARPEKLRERSNLLGEDERLGYWELRALALEWDREGESYPIEFLRAISCEIRGHRRHSIVREALN